MPTKIRLQRHGKKNKPFYHVVIADSRAPRDGKFIEKIGIYNPNVNPAVIDIDTEKAFNWIQKGAVPTDTVRAMLSYKGVLLRNHLQKGVAKGALTQEQADAKFEAWLQEKEGKIQSKKDQLSANADAAKKAKLAAEKEVSDARAAAIEQKNSPMAEEVEAPTEAEATTEAPAEAEAAPEAKEEAPAEAEAAPEAKEEAPAEAEAATEAKEEAPAEAEAAPEAKEEAPAEAEAASEAKEEAPAEAEAAPEAKEEAPAEAEAAPEAKEEAPAEAEAAPEAKEEAPAEAEAAPEAEASAEEGEEKKEE